jgi:hypothetical protein
MELDFGTKFTLHLWFEVGVRGIFGELWVSLVRFLLFFCDYFVELLRDWWRQKQTSERLQYDHLQHRTSRPHAASSGCLPAK